MSAPHEVQAPTIRGSCPANGCSPVVRADGSVSSAMCPRCGWGGYVDAAGRPILDLAV
jgi:hypothetical protein